MDHKNMGHFYEYELRVNNSDPLYINAHSIEHALREVGNLQFDETDVITIRQKNA